MTTIPVNKTIAVLDGRHELTVLRLAREPDSFCLDYVVRPALPDDTPGGEALFMFVEASDDSGRSYADWGGARGLGEDGSQTRGSVAVQPALLPETREVTVRFVFLRRGEETGYELLIHL